MVITLHGIHLAVKDRGHIDGTIEKLDYIQIFFIPGYAIGQMQVHRLIICVRVRLTAPITYQRLLTTDTAGKIDVM